MPTHLILQENGILPLGKCHVYEHQGTEFPELYYRALRVECSMGGDKTESLLLMANSVTEKAQWMADFSQVRRRRVWGCGLESCDCHVITDQFYCCSVWRTKSKTRYSKVRGMIFKSLFQSFPVCLLRMKRRMLTAQSLIETFVSCVDHYHTHPAFVGVAAHSIFCYDFMMSSIFSSVLESQWN